MSDTSQGPGWWLASDGKWYPPEQSPGFASPGAPASVPSVPRAATLPAEGPPPVGTAPPGAGEPGASAPPPAPPSVPPPGVSTGTLPPPAYAPPTAYPPGGAPPPGAYPPGAYPPGAYPPGAYPPGAYPPGPYAPGPGRPYGPYGARPRTSGLAVASFVLALLWLGGLGSLLAVVFAIVALVGISRARGARRGRGWAIAGLVIGTLGLLLSIGLGIAISQAVNATTYPYGHTVATDDGVTGFTSVTTYGVTSGFHGIGGSAEVNGVYAAAAVQVCVGPAGMPDVKEHLAFFLLQVRGGILPAEPEVTTQRPNLYSGTSWPPGQCQRGYLSFLVPPGDTLTGVRYQGDLLHPIEWTPTGH